MPAPASADPFAAERRKARERDPDVPAPPLPRLRGRLIARLRESVERHRDFVTVRREDLRWRIGAPGWADAALARGACSATRLVRLEPGTALPWADGALAQEALLLEGRLGGAAQGLERGSLVLRGSAGAEAPHAGEGAAQMYVRDLLAAPPAAEATWWQAAGPGLRTVAAGRRRWQAAFPGVQTLLLWGAGPVVSMLVRFAPGAGVPDHRHAIDEDCLMLEGEMFLGDILLRAGDYQLAPAGGGHFGETSEAGGTFFFHGALDAALAAGA